MTEGSRDWFKTGVHFIFGVACGMFVGIHVVTDEIRMSDAESLLATAGCALGVGLLAAWQPDLLWSGLRNRWWH